MLTRAAGADVLKLHQHHSSEITIQYKHNNNQNKEKFMSFILKYLCCVFKEKWTKFNVSKFINWWKNNNAVNIIVIK